MISPLIFYAVVMMADDHTLVVDIYRDLQACESASYRARAYLRDRDMLDVRVKCISTRYRDADLAQQDIDFAKKLKSGIK